MSVTTLNTNASVAGKTLAVCENANVFSAAQKIKLDQSDVAGAGCLSLTNVADTRRWSARLDTGYGFNLDYYDGAAWTKWLGLTAAGGLSWGGGAAISSSSNVALLNAVNVIAAQGVHDFSGTANSYQIVRALTTSAGTAARSVFRGTAGAVTGDVATYSEGYTTAGLNIQGSTLLSNDGAGGVTIAATHASGPIRLVAGGTTTRVTIATTGALTLAAHVAGTPTFVAGDKYLVVDGSGNVHVSALGPAS